MVSFGIWGMTITKKLMIMYHFVISDLRLSVTMKFNVARLEMKHLDFLLMCILQFILS